MSDKRNVKLNGRRDFWNTKFHPITGWFAPKIKDNNNKVDKTFLKAEYNYNPSSL